MPRHRAFIAISAFALSACASEPLRPLREREAPNSGGAGGSLGGVSTGGNASSDGGAVSGGGVGGCAPGQSVLVGELINARDLGGTRLEGNGAVACGGLFRGPPLANLSEQGCTAFAELGVRTVIDLRTADERASKPETPCVEGTASLVFAPLPIPYNVSPTDYIADLNTLDSVAAAFHVLGDEASYPVYFHCTWGRDRTGILAAVILLALGATRADILQEYLLSSQSVGAYPSSLEAVLDEVERRGGVLAYLAELGVSEAEIATLRARNVAP